MVLAAVAALSLTLPAHADFKVVQKNHTDPATIMGREQPARDIVSTTWVGDGMLRMDEGDSSYIVRLDRKKLYLVDHGEKKVTEVDIPIDLSKYLPPQMQQMVGQMMKMSATVTPTGETRKVGPWKARKYLIKISSPMMSTEQVAWASKDVGFDASAYAAMAAEIMKLQPGMAEVVKELAKVDGMVVLQESTTTVMGTSMKSRQEVVSVEKSGPPPGGYEPPSGYAREPFDPMKMMQKKK
jgi:hypothetical protein